MKRGPRNRGTVSSKGRKSRAVFVAIGLGGNVGRPRAAFRQALGSLLPFLSNPRLSGLYRTSPVGGPRQPDFLNAVVVGETCLAPLELLGLLKRLERAAGRTPGGPRNGPRPLDLDILLYGSRRVSLPRLKIPHPGMRRRLFVLVPLAELAPGRVVPGTRRTVARLLLEESARSAARVTLLRVRRPRTVTAWRPTAPRRAARTGADPRRA